MFFQVLKNWYLFACARLFADPSVGFVMMPGASALQSTYAAAREMADAMDHDEELVNLKVALELRRKLAAAEPGALIPKFSNPRKEMREKLAVDPLALHSWKIEMTPPQALVTSTRGAAPPVVPEIFTRLRQIHADVLVFAVIDYVDGAVVVLRADRPPALLMRDLLLDFKPGDEFIRDPCSMRYAAEVGPQWFAKSEVRHSLYMKPFEHDYWTVKRFVVHAYTEVFAVYRLLAPNGVEQWVSSEEDVAILFDNDPDARIGWYFEPKSLGMLNTKYEVEMRLKKAPVSVIQDTAKKVRDVSTVRSAQPDSELPEALRDEPSLYYVGCLQCSSPCHRRPTCPKYRNACARAGVTCALELPYRFCAYPLCPIANTHDTSMCPFLHARCRACTFRGHVDSHHESYSINRMIRDYNRFRARGILTRFASDDCEIWEADGYTYDYVRRFMRFENDSERPYYIWTEDFELGRDIGQIGNIAVRDQALRRFGKTRYDPDNPLDAPLQVTNAPKPPPGTPRRPLALRRSRSGAAAMANALAPLEGFLRVAAPENIGQLLVDDDNDMLSDYEPSPPPSPAVTRRMSRGRAVAEAAGAPEAPAAGGAEVGAEAPAADGGNDGAGGAAAPLVGALPAAGVVRGRGRGRGRGRPRAAALAPRSHAPPRLPETPEKKRKF